MAAASTVRKSSRPETVALMAVNQIGDIEAGHMKTTNPALSNDVDFFPGTRLRWGLGHMINPTRCLMAARPAA